MGMTVFTKKYSPPEFNEKEILRYALCDDADENVTELVKQCIKECKSVFTYNVCYCELPVEIRDGNVESSFLKTDSKALGKNLTGCKKIILFCNNDG